MEVIAHQNSLVANINIILFLCCIRKKWWVNDSRIFTFGWTDPLSIILVSDTADCVWLSCNDVESLRIVKYRRLIIGQPQFPVLRSVFRPSPTQTQLTHLLHLPACMEATNVFTVPPSLKESVWLWVWCIIAFAWMSAVDDFSCEGCGMFSLFTLTMYCFISLLHVLLCESVMCLCVGMWM